ncbi:hypothetical protein OGAPHI_007400 [Ogataea philodendri]|uniref:Uncharacterized protein n=1 Tax=Ogataea philodendri TaxID=1378263 RepID=A0A9P8NUZ5_9ASCO|nr:uncharacterized protein OGAPHI_007400 [Ogataea philodendri]KAH3660195.1 hypothetical protein OGAPHI_007400 [Ogataea philodendri]
MSSVVNGWMLKALESTFISSSVGLRTSSQNGGTSDAELLLSAIIEGVGVDVPETLGLRGSVSPGSTFETNGYWKLIRSSVPFAEDCCDRAVDASVIFLNSSSSSSTNCCRTEISGQTLRFPASSRLSTGKQTSSREEALDDLLEDGLDEPYTEFDSSSSSPEPYESELGSSLYGDVGEEDRFKVDSNGFSVLYWTPLKEWFCLRALL